MPDPSTAGSERFVAVSTDVQWAELTTALGRVDPRAGKGLATTAGRRAGAVELDAALTECDCNDELIGTVADYPRFASAMLTRPLPDIKASLEELRRIGSHPAVSGIMLDTTMERCALDERRFEPPYTAAASLGLPLFLHPVLDPLPAQFADWRLGDSLAPPLSTSLTAVRLMLSGMLDRVPDLTLIIPHLGGVLPYLAQRLIDQSGRGDADHDLLYYLRRRIYLDTCSFHEPALVRAQDTVGTERIVIGSDYPFRGPITRCMDDIATLRLTASLSVRLW